MDDPAGIELATPLRLAHVEKKPKKVWLAEDFYVFRALSDAEDRDLKLVRSLIVVGGDLGPYYRRSTKHDRLLASRGIMHLHLCGPGSDVILYCIQYPNDVLFLCVDTHTHLDVEPPGRAIRTGEIRTFETTIRKRAVDQVQARKNSIASLLAGILPGRRPKG